MNGLHLAAMIIGIVAIIYLPWERWVRFPSFTGRD